MDPGDGVGGSFLRRTKVDLGDGVGGPFLRRTKVDLGDGVRGPFGKLLITCTELTSIDRIGYR